MSRSHRILQVGTHATLRPIHGGQLRSHHIGRVLEEAGYTVRGIAITTRQDHDIVNDRERILDLGMVRHWKGEIAGGCFGDYFLYTTVDEDPNLRKEFFRLAEAASPDVLLLEHPWMWPLVRLIPKVAAGLAPVIYNSQNVEAHLKRKMIQDLALEGTALSEAEALLPAADSLEKDAVTHADAVTVCTEEDAVVFDAWGAKRTVLARNGSSRRPTTGIRRPLPALLPAGCRYAFLVGSEHLPNTTGFENLVVPWLASLRPGHRIVVAGGVCDGIRSRIAKRGISATLEERLVLLGRVSDIALSALIENAASIILPIEYGGGSNIKTAEALLSDRCIVASPAAFRGFGEYTNLPGITVADGPAAFGRAVLSALANGSPALRNPPSVAALTWDATLAPLVALVDSLIR